MNESRCEVKPGLIALTAVLLVVTLLAAVIVVPAFVAVIVIGNPEPKSTSLPSVDTGHLVQSEREESRP